MEKSMIKIKDGKKKIIDSDDFYKVNNYIFKKKVLY